jgi:hypothetical protein
MSKLKSNGFQSAVTTPDGNQSMFFTSERMSTPMIASHTFRYPEICTTVSIQSIQDPVTVSTMKDEGEEYVEFCNYPSEEIKLTLDYKHTRSISLVRE